MSLGSCGEELAKKIAVVKEFSQNQIIFTLKTSILRDNSRQWSHRKRYPDILIGRTIAW